MGDFDRIKKSLAGFVKTVMNRVDYLALYPARVAAQNIDNTLELVPDDGRLPGVSNVPIRLGLPGAVAKVAAGARVLLGFAAGDPRQPIATLWEPGSVTELDLSATNIVLNSGTHAVGRVGDRVDVTIDATAAAKLTCASAPGVCSLTAGSFTISGTITAGAPGVKA